jgi:hypothetical protein
MNKFMHQKISTILIEITLYINILFYSKSKILRSINFLLANVFVNYFALCALCLGYRGVRYVSLWGIKLNLQNDTLT